MLSARTFAAIVVIGSMLAASPAHGQVAERDTLYALESPPSEFDSGCFGPCECASIAQFTLTGTFLLHRSSSGPLFTDYVVRDLRWVASGAGEPVTITGSGSYRRGNDASPFQELALDLSFGEGRRLHFTSGPQSSGGSFPRIDARLWLHGESCEDSLVVVSAAPAGVVSGGGDPRTHRSTSSRGRSRATW
jgi:hypothetical protein